MPNSSHTHHTHPKKNGQNRPEKNVGRFFSPKAVSDFLHENTAKSLVQSAKDGYDRYVVWKEVTWKDVTLRMIDFSGVTIQGTNITIHNI